MRLQSTKIMLTMALGLLFINSAVRADTYLTDPEHTLVGFTVRHLMINKVRGKFNDFTGTIELHEQDMTQSSLRGTIKVASIDTDNEKRDAHLRSADFFDAENYPEITFASKRVAIRDDQPVLVGDLTIRETTREVEIPFEITGKIVDPRGQTRIGFEASLRLDRKDFGVNYHKIMDNGGLVVGDTIDIELVGEAIKQST